MLKSLGLKNTVQSFLPEQPIFKFDVVSKQSNGLYTQPLVDISFVANDVSVSIMT